MAIAPPTRYNMDHQPAFLSLPEGILIPIQLCCLATATGLPHFGLELVYPDPPSAGAGTAIGGT